LRRDEGAFGMQVASELSVGLGVGIVVVNNHARGGIRWSSGRCPVMGCSMVGARGYGSGSGGCEGRHGVVGIVVIIVGIVVISNCVGGIGGVDVSWAGVFML